MNIYVVPLEKMETRYTKQWYYHIPNMLKRFNNNTDTQIYLISVYNENTKETAGAFINFVSTNEFKSKQLIGICKLFENKEIKAGDKFLYTDAWNPTIFQLRYMADLQNIPIEIHGMWHAGSWDENDFLGRADKDCRFRQIEQALIRSIDYNWVATNYAKEKLSNNLFLNERTIENKLYQTGWPMEYLNDDLEPYKDTFKKPQIIFPHRIAPEKRLDLFIKLQKSLPQYSFVISQEKRLTKHGYHTQLAESKLCLSFSEQETFGISMTMEAPLLNTFPLAPNRLSYKEIFCHNTKFMYPEEWIKEVNHDLPSFHLLVEKVVEIMETPQEQLNEYIKSYRESTMKSYGCATSMYKKLLETGK